MRGARFARPTLLRIGYIEQRPAPVTMRQLTDQRKKVTKVLWFFSKKGTAFFLKKEAKTITRFCPCKRPVSCDPHDHRGAGAARFGGHENTASAG